MTENETEKSLMLPDPRQQPVPRGFATETFAPIAHTLTWNELEDAEAQLRALASYIDSFDGDAMEFEKALRIIEYRRGVLLGPDRAGGGPTPENFPRVESLDVAPATASRYRKIARAWEKVLWPHLIRATDRRDVTQAQILRLADRVEAQTNAANVETCSVKDLHELCERGVKFGTIYADPPWPYDNQATRASTGNHYQTPSLEWIAGIPVGELVAENAHLHLWTTNAFLFDAQCVMESWGFTYKSCFVWVKPQMGIGNYWRVSHEFLLLGVRGSQPFLDHSEMSWREFPRTRHSAKPAPIYEIIERVSPGPFLELFARRQRNGWVSWGNEIERDLFYKGAA